MYDREYDGRTVRFEPSGGLLHDALVMQDKETDSYWSIMTGDSIAGRYFGTPLKEIPAGVKMQWKDWMRDHPDTLVLSINGREWVGNNPYDNYFSSDETFSGVESEDRRLAAKEPVFTFVLGGVAYAVPFRAIEGGRAFELGDQSVFLFRPPDAAIYFSTGAWRTDAGRFEQVDGVWTLPVSGATFDEARRRFEGLEPLVGLDTFWYIWSRTRPETRVLGN